MSLMERVQHLKIPLEEIKLATSNFSDENIIGGGGYGPVYKGQLTLSGQQTTVAIKRLDRKFGQGDHEFLKEIQMLSRCKHTNLISLVRFCDENGENILVYEYAKHGSLNSYLKDFTNLPWMQRLRLSIGAAHGFKYLHDEVSPHHRVLHCDIKSANILIDHNWDAKISDFGLSVIGPSNVEDTFVVANPVGTRGYVDPQYVITGILTKECDVYSFGVVLFELLCGRPAVIDEYKDERRFLASLAVRHYDENRLNEIIHPSLVNQMKVGSLKVFSTVAYQCLKQDRSERPTMGIILEELEKALDLQAGNKIAGFNATRHLTTVQQHLRIPLDKIIEATNNFSLQNYIAKGGFGNVYKGRLSWNGDITDVAVKKLDLTSDQGEREFFMEIIMLSSYRHKNLASLVGFCDEGKGKDKLLVYVHESRGSLDRYIHRPNLTWMQRLKISIDIARGLNYLHRGVGQHSAIHRDVKSSNILLNHDWEAKVSDFGLSKIGPSNLQHKLSKIGPSNLQRNFFVTYACGTFGYIDPAYYKTGVLTHESDIYSFGVVLFEILCGRLACVEGAKDGHVFLSPLAERKYKENKIDDIILPSLRKQMKLNSLNVFSGTAYQCLKADRSERPTLAQIIEKLENALELQTSLKTVEFARTGIWGTKASRGPQNRWAFFLEKDHKLKMITIDHGNLIYSLKFSSELKGVLYTSDKAGGWNGGETVSEVMLQDDEEIIGIDGTVGVSGGYTIISSLSFVTNKKTHGPFGRATETSFSVPWEKGTFGGFYGLAGYYIEGIGVYMKASEEISRVGIWGAKDAAGPQNQWSFQLERNHHLKKISIDHGDIIYSLMFTTEYRGDEQTSDRAGGWNGGDIVEEVTFALDEEINAISGTVGEYEGYTIISSLTFITNQKTHGPYGNTGGTPFTVPWDTGSFAGFYGLASYYIDGIGVYLKAII